MKKILVLALISIFLISLASAIVNVEYNFKEGIHRDSQFIETSIPVNGVSSLGVVSTSSNCATTNGYLWNGNSQITNSDSIILTYPTALQSSYGYGVYHYKDGYIPYETTANWNGYGDEGAYSKYPAKKENCVSGLSGSDINLAGQKLTATATVSSPIKNSGPLNYIPAEIKSHYQTAVNTVIEVRNSDDKTLIYTEAIQKIIDYSQNADVEFTKVLPPGKYNVKIYTKLNDEAKCSGYLEDAYTKENIVVNYPDSDGDGYASNIDCNDNNVNVWGLLNGYIDNDKDNYGTGLLKSVCSGNNLPVGYANNNNDCNDNDTGKWRLLNGYIDNDKDGYGVGILKSVCSGSTLPFGYSQNNKDCNDYDATKTLDCSVDLFPLIKTISANPLTGIAPLKVNFNCEAEEGNLPLSYSWNFGDRESSLVQNPTHIYSVSGNYTATCTVTDSDGDKDAKSVKVEVRQDELKIKELTCFEKVVEGHNQSCSILVKNSFGIAEPNVGVEFYYSDGGLFGTCTTDAITGKCEAKDLQDTVGNYQIYSVAKKTDFIGDLSKTLRFNYSVLKEKYFIQNLKVYADELLTVESSEFFRGDKLFIRFSVVDSSGNPAGNLITKATLISPTGGKADLAEKSNSNGVYVYVLSSIPKTYEFFGESRIFTFVFNFADDSGGQEEIAITIKNNFPKIIGVIPNQSVEIGKTISVDLSEYESDDEDSGENLRWEITAPHPKVYVEIIGKTLYIKGLTKGTENLALRLYDLNRDYDGQIVGIKIISGDSGSGSKGSKSKTCNPIWDCTEWSSCVNGMKTRSCTDLKGCEKDFSTPSEIETCTNAFLFYETESSSIGLGSTEESKIPSLDLNLLFLVLGIMTLIVIIAVLVVLLRR